MRKTQVLNVNFVLIDMGKKSPKKKRFTQVAASLMFYHLKLAPTIPTENL